MVRSLSPAPSSSDDDFADPQQFFAEQVPLLATVYTELMHLLADVHPELGDGIELNGFLEFVRKGTLVCQED